VQGDITSDLQVGPFDVVLVAYNTIFNLLGEHDQPRLFQHIAERLAPGGAFVVEAFVPASDGADGTATSSEVTVRSMAVDHVVLSVSVHDAARQTADGQFVEITESGGVRLRPWSIRWSTPAQLDAMAVAAGLVVERRTSGFEALAAGLDEPVEDRHVTVYRRVL
jgi:hypothetical protein